MSTACKPLSESVAQGIGFAFALGPCLLLLSPDTSLAFLVVVVSRSTLLSMKSAICERSVLSGLSERHTCLPRRGRELRLSAQALFTSLPNIGSQNKRTVKKAELLEEIGRLDRGASASPSDREKVDGLARELERLNPNKAALKSPLINARWTLLYTTSSSILALSRPPALRPKGPIYQTIDAINLRAVNQETWPFFNKVEADLTPISQSEVAVQFKTFRILGLIPIQAPPSARGKLDTTYLDETLRVSRGDRGNLFVLERPPPAS